MKRVLVIALMLIMTIACWSEPNPKGIIAVIQNRYAWLPKDDAPYVDTRSSNTTGYMVCYPTSRLILLLDKQATLTGADFNIGVEREKPVEFLTRFNEDFIWKLRPDIPRDKMILTSDDGLYQLLRADGVVDSGVWLSMVKVRGVLTGFWAGNKPSIPPIPAVKITEAEARAISQAVAKDFVSKSFQGVVSSWPYALEQHKRRSLAGIHTDSLGSTYVCYQFIYQLSDKPEEDKTRTLTLLDVSVNATTGDVVYARVMPTYAKVASTDKPVSQFPAVTVIHNATEVTLGFPCILDGAQAYVPLVTIQSLAIGHKATAKAKARVFTLDGRKLALPSEVIEAIGLLYLPWQSLNSLPGVTAQFDTTSNKLEITTPKAAK